MKRGRLPLTALRSFEAAGRHLSFGRAAEELLVSQAAISRQIRELETLLGTALFERLHRRVRLTDAGRALLGELTTSFDRIDRQLSEVSGQSPANSLKITVEPAFAGAWLVPRLDRFRAAFPEVDLVLDDDSRVVEFRGSDMALGIRHSLHLRSWPRLEAEHLTDIVAMPLISPALLAAGPPLAEPAALAAYTLLHEENRDGWAHWLRAAGVGDIAARHGPVYPDASLASQAALLGHGVVLGDDVLNGADIAAGRLIAPFALSLPYGAYWLVAPRFADLGLPARAFVTWLRQEIRAGSTAEPARR